MKLKTTTQLSTKLNRVSVFSLSKLLVIFKFCFQFIKNGEKYSIGRKIAFSFSGKKSFGFVLVLSLLTLTFSDAWSQSNANYTYGTVITGSLTDMTSGTTELSLNSATLPNSVSHDDDATPVTSFTEGSTNPFVFHFMGTPYTQFSMNSNGQVRLGSTVIIGTHVSTYGGAGYSYLCPITGDNSILASGKVHYKVTGTAPNRIAILEWSGLKIPLGGSYAGNNLQLRLYENTGVFEYVYGAMVCSTTTRCIGWSSGSSATTNTWLNTIAATPSNQSSTTWTATSFGNGNMTNLYGASDGSRRIFSWTPNVTPAAPTSLTFTSVGFTGMTLNWTDNSTTEYNFAIYNSSDGGTTWNYVDNKASTTTVATGGAYTYSVTGLTAATTYTWRVYAVSEGKYSTALSGSQATSSCSSGLSGVKSVGPSGDYSTLTAAISAINTSGVSAAALTLELNATYVSTSETFPLTLTNTTGCLSATNLVTIRPASGVTARTITSTNTTATIDINGGSYWIIDGRAGGSGSTKQLTISNTSTSTGGTAIRFINEASNNTVKYCTLKSTYSSSSSGVVMFSTTTGSNGNDNNTIDYCDIDGGAGSTASPTTGVAQNGVYSVGSTSSVGIQNSGNTISNNNIYNNFVTGGASNINNSGVSLSSGNTDWTISGNSFYQTSTRTGTTSGTAATAYFGVYISNPTQGNNFTVTNNYIGGDGVNANVSSQKFTFGGAVLNYLYGLFLNVGTSTASSVQGNTIKNISLQSSVTSGSGGGYAGGPNMFFGINITAGAVNIGNVTANTIGSNSVSATSSANSSIAILQSTNNGGVALGIYSASTSTLNISNNSIGGFYLAAASGSNTLGSSFYGIYLSAASTNTLYNNTIGSTTNANSIYSVGSQSASNTSANALIGISMSAGTNTIGGSSTNQPNFIQNINYASPGASTAVKVFGIEATGGTNTISGNTVSNLSNISANTGSGTSASICGILVNASSTNHSVSKNTVYALSNNCGSATVVYVNGIYFNSSTGTNLIEKNLVYNISTTATSASYLNAIAAVGGTATYQNNVVRMGYNETGASSITGGHVISGIIESAGTNKLYHNTVYVGGTGVTGSSASAAFRSAVTTTTRTYQNNIFVNARSNSSGTGKHYAIYSSATANTGLTSDYNDLYVSGTGGLVGYFNAADKTTLANWSTASRDANSISSDPAFVNPTAATPDLSLSSGSPCDVVGTAIATVTDDYSSLSRSSNTPTDIGAYAILGCSSPSNQSTSFVYSNIAEQSMTLGWTRGNGNNVMIVAKAGSAPTDPTSGTSYTANAAYASGSACGGGYVVYSGTGTSVNLTGLTGNITYHFAAYEFNTTGTCYNTTQLTGNSATLDQETWLGVTSTDWNTGSNWSSGYVPYSTTNVTIPSGTSYAPTIAASEYAVCKNLTINSSATLTENAPGAYYFAIYGNITCNGTFISNTLVELNGGLVSDYATISGSGDMSLLNLDLGFDVNIGYYKLLNDIALEQFYLDSYFGNSIFDMNGYNLTVGFFDIESSTTFYQKTGILYIEDDAASINNTSFVESTGTTYFSSGTVWLASSQIIPSITYYNLKVRTNNTYTATIGDGSSLIVTGDLTILNPSTAGGTATLGNDISVTGNTNLGTTGNALTLTVPPLYRIIGTGSFSMGNVAGHVINIQYTSASNFAITCSGTPTFYGTVTYTSASAQKVITASSYNNLTFDLAGTKTLFGNLDVNGNLTLTAGTFDVSTFNVNLAGDFVKQTASTFTANTATFTFDGTSTQYVNVTSAGGTTACNLDITFYNVVIDGTDVKIYYNKTNDRKYNTNDFTVNSGKQVSFISQ